MMFGGIVGAWQGLQDPDSRTQQDQGPATI
jgi:hypothetical protein